MSIQIQGHVANTKWVAERPDVVELTVLVATEDLGHAPAPLPKDIALVIPEPIPAPTVNDGLMTITVTKEMLDDFPDSIRRLLQQSHTERE